MGRASPVLQLGRGEKELGLGGGKELHAAGKHGSRPAPTWQASSLGDLGA